LSLVCIGEGTDVCVLERVLTCVCWRGY